MMNVILDMLFVMSTGQLGKVICTKLKFRGEVSAGGREHIHFSVVVGVTSMVI